MQHEGVRFQWQNDNTPTLLVLNVTCQEEIIRLGTAECKSLKGFQEIKWVLAKRLSSVPLALNKSHCSHCSHYSKTSCN